MRWITPVAAGALLIGVVGCETADRDLKPRGPLSESHRAVNESMLQGFNLEEVDNAVIRQHTLYPYHFVTNGSELNTLGQREVYVLAHHYQTHPGPLNVHRGDEPDALYQARVQSVMHAMIDGGVPANKVAIADGMPGGEGMPSDRVVLILDRMKSSKLTGAAQGQGSTGGVKPSEAANTSSTAGKPAGDTK